MNIFVQLLINWENCYLHISHLSFENYVSYGKYEGQVFQRKLANREPNPFELLQAESGKGTTLLRLGCLLLSKGLYCSYYITIPLVS